MLAENKYLPFLPSFSLSHRFESILPGLVVLETSQCLFVEVVLVGEVCEEPEGDLTSDGPFTVRALSISWQAEAAKGVTTRRKHYGVREYLNTLVALQVPLC